MTEQLNIEIKPSKLIQDYLILISIWIIVFALLNLPGMADDYRILWLISGLPSILLYGLSSTILIPKLKENSQGFMHYVLRIALISVTCGILLSFCHSAVFNISSTYVFFLVLFFCVTPQILLVAPITWLIYDNRWLKAENIKGEKVYEVEADTLPAGNLPEYREYFFIKSGYEQVKVNFTDIHYAEATGNYVNFVLQNSNVITRMTIKEAEAILPDGMFVRVHRSFIVAIDKIDKIERHQITVNDSVLPIGRSYYNNIEQIKNT